MRIRLAGSGEILNYRLNTHQGFTQVAVAPPEAIAPEQVLRHHRQAQGRYGGTGFCPLLPHTSASYSYPGKNISPEPFGYFLYLLPDAGKKIRSSCWRNILKACDRK